MIRVDAWWLAVQPLDMRVGTEAALARVVQVFGQAHPHHAYLFANRRANRMKVLVHDGIGVWLAARRLNIGKFTWSDDAASTLFNHPARYQWEMCGKRGSLGHSTASSMFLTIRPSSVSPVISNSRLKNKVSGSSWRASSCR